MCGGAFRKERNAMFLRDYKIIVRMAIGFAVLLILLISMTTMGIMNLGRTQKSLEKIVNDNNVKVHMSQDMRFLARHEAVVIRNILLLKDATQKEYELKRIEEEREKYEEMQDALIKMIRGDGDKEKDIIKRIVEGKDITIPLWNKVIQLGMAGKQEEGIRILIEEIRPVQWEWLGSLDDMVTLQKEMAQQSAKEAFTLYNRARMTALSGGILATIIGLLFAVIITLSITMPLSDITGKISKIAQGDLTIRMREDKNDEIGILGRHINQMVGIRKQYEEKLNRSYHIQNVISSVLKISLEPVPLEQQLERILDLILSIPWISLESKGCIFLVEDEPDVLVMKVQRNLKEFKETTCAKIPFGRCFCGRTASSRTIVFADHVDERHDICHKDMPPHGHYCVPIQSENRLIGVINLYVKEGYKREQGDEEFLSAVADTIAGIIERKKTELEREHLKKELVHSERLSALGRLAANVAHEIRNPLTALGGFARRLQKKVAEGTIEKTYCEIIISEENRLEKILKNVLVFSTDIPLKIGSHDINEIVSESLKVYEDIFKKQSITIRTSITDVPLLPIDKEQIKCVIENLISNAVDSMPKGGTLSVATNKEFLHGIPYVVVKIMDEGEGIPEEKLCKLFEPFFTTKAVEQFYGTGLGLSISRKIMEEHCGFIKAESMVKEGSIFSLYFPYQGPEDSSKVQCWQYLKCGRDCDTEKRCPAYPNYGRSCWVIAGTYCGGKIKGSHAEKIETCRKCPFYESVMAKEGPLSGSKSPSTSA
jgi:signal transduction histidine kinase/HAMP domain-containing protein